MSDLDKALADIIAIRSQIAAGTAFRGYGPAAIAATGGVALLTAVLQYLWLGDPNGHPLTFLFGWAAAAAAGWGAAGAGETASSLAATLGAVGAGSTVTEQAADPLIWSPLPTAAGPRSGSRVPSASFTASTSALEGMAPSRTPSSHCPASAATSPSTGRNASRSSTRAG